MRWLFIPALILLGSISTRGQNIFTTFQVFTNTNTNFIFNTPESLENDQVLQNAFTIRVWSLVGSCSVYASLANFTYPPGYIPKAGIFSLKWQSDNVLFSKYLNKSEIPLSNMNQLLLQQYAGFAAYDYNYNLVLRAPGYDLIPGNYSFSILFTMTKP